MKEPGIKMRKELGTMGSSIRIIRKARGLSQTALASLMEISNKSLDNIEAGRNWPSLPVYITICRVLDLPTPPLLDKFEADSLAAIVGERRRQVADPVVKRPRGRPPTKFREEPALA